MNKVNKAVFPVAGMGTRFLPATKSSPKEMLPIVDKPLIQYAVEEAIAAGITEMIFITNSTKGAIKDHFTTNFELEKKLQKQGKQEFLNIIKNILPKNISCVYVDQPQALGLGHAVLCAKENVGNETFAVLLVDDLIDGGKHNCLRQLIDIYAQTNSSVIAVQQIPPEDSRKYGVIDFDGEINHAIKINQVVEKPEPKNAPSNFGVVGRYILKPQIFDLLENIAPGSGGEIQLTDAIDKLIQNDDVYACKFAGTRYDCGNKLGYLHATIQYALKHPEVAEDFRKLLRELHT
jgi:UTP--glucose-1-phosphate uridylyltransferase